MAREALAGRPELRRAVPRVHRNERQEDVQAVARQVLRAGHVRAVLVPALVPGARLAHDEGAGHAAPAAPEDGAHHRLDPAPDPLLHAGAQQKLLHAVADLEAAIVAPHDLLEAALRPEAEIPGARRRALQHLGEQGHRLRQQGLGHGQGLGVGHEPALVELVRQRRQALLLLLRHPRPAAPRALRRGRTGGDTRTSAPRTTSQNARGAGPPSDRRGLLPPFPRVPPVSRSRGCDFVRGSSEDPARQSPLLPPPGFPGIPRAAFRARAAATLGPAADAGGPAAPRTPRPTRSVEPWVATPA